MHGLNPVVFLEKQSRAGYTVIIFIKCGHK